MATVSVILFHRPMASIVLKKRAMSSATRKKRQGEAWEQAPRGKLDGNG